MRSTVTKIKREGGLLTATVPVYVLPRRAEEIVVEYEPGEYLETTSWVRLETGAYGSDGRLPVFVPYYFLSFIGLDPTRNIELRLYRYPVWVISHLYHDYPSGRVWIPRRVAEELNLRPNWKYSFLIRGFAPPIERERIREIGKITISHLNKDYETTTRKWTLPIVTGIFSNIEIRPEEIFGWAIDRGFNIFAEWYYEERAGFVTVDFTIKGSDDAHIVDKNQRGFRSSATINAGLTEDRGYEFRCDVKTQYISSYPRMWYIDPNDKRIQLVKALAWTSKNIFDGHVHTANAAAGTQTGMIRRRDKKGRWKEPEFRDKALVVPHGTITKGRPDEYEGYENEPIGEAEMYEHDEHGVDIGKYKLDYAYKYVGYIRGHYDNADLERTIPTKETKTPSDKIWRDKLGFVWWR